MTPTEPQLAAQLDRIENRLRALARRIDARVGPRMLITGGTGTLGTALTQHFLAAGYQLTVLSRDAHRQAVYQQQFPQVETVLADICDADAVRQACSGQDIVIHAAALKRVDIGETQVAEFARVNIDGTRVVAQCADLAGVGQALFISSDKAVMPLNFYGLTKAVGERLWLEHNHSQCTVPERFSVVRYGNVMGSNGSVLQIWRQRLAENKPLMVRSPSTTRFFMRLQDAVQLVVDALAAMQGGEIFVPRQTPAFDLFELAREFAPDSAWDVQPLGPREKIDEVLLALGEYWEECGPHMLRVWPDRGGKFAVPPDMFSATAPHLSGAAAVARLEGA